jgi:hypothetical protein
MERRDAELYALRRVPSRREDSEVEDEDDGIVGKRR